MGFLLFLGNALIALGPVFSVLTQNIFAHPARVVVMIVGAFMYFAALVLVGTIWRICDALGMPSGYIALFAILSVFAQEAARYATFVFMKAARPSFSFLKETERNSVQNVAGSAISIGAGFALAAAVFASINALVFSLQPGVPGINRMDGADIVPHSSQLFVIRSIEAGALGLLNFFWTMIMFHALESQATDSPSRSGGGRFWLAVVVLTHLVNTLLSLVAHNTNQTLCVLSLVVAWSLVFALAGVTGYAFGGSRSTVKAAMSAARRTDTVVNPAEARQEFRRSMSGGNSQHTD